jgi:membrane-associated phospholipid phosphatase
VQPSYKAIWSEQWRSRRFRIEFLITIPLTVAALATLAHFLNWVETRPGVTFVDPVLALFPAVDLTWLTFGLIYLGIISGIVFLTRHPRAMLIAFQSYVLMVVVRIAAMYVLPLAAPPTAIPLQDPTVQYLGTGKLLTQDLFFSGHTSTLFLLFLTAQGKGLRTVFLVCTIAVGLAVLVQHVHWTVDVLVAPVVAYTCFRVATLLAHRRWSGNASASSVDH